MVNPALLGQLDLAAAVTAELGSTSRLLPAHSCDVALVAHAQDAERHIHASLKRNATAKPASVVFAAKQKGSRPLNLWRLQDRVLYRALTDRIRLQLPGHLQTRMQHIDFVKQPFDKSANVYINVTDISSFYAYIDHDVLANELIAQTADYHAVTALTALLEQVMGGRVGIPQVHYGSDILGDTYIDPIRRRLIRAGFDTYTFSDDFRIGAKSLGQARAALELCAATAREYGLVLNESKTYTYHRTTYKWTLNPRSVAEQTILDTMELNDAAEFLFFGPYANGEDPDKPVPDLSGLEGAGPATADGDDTTHDEPGQVDPKHDHLLDEVWRIWIRSQSESHPPQVLRQLLIRALPRLGSAGNSAPLGKLDELIREAPDLTPAVAKYIVNLVGVDPDQRPSAEEAIDRIAGSDILSEWQKIWLAHTAGVIGKSDESPAGIFTWLRDSVRFGDGALTAYAAEALARYVVGANARRKNMIAADLAGALNRVTEEHRLPIVWALGQLTPATARQAADNGLDRLLVPAGK
ncbi:RNA-directed DNA polymerase [Rhodococcus tukisamuensis]|uniref:Reverse transcriptase (RNA-dependent DNA polymerase) n=1 Tax=Rhodococcus tukisamuensis TaxID=168276 RepID=A0A1G6TB65_9NOCA|nr:RNA-directed DNA polymerase [Rhodococcus tukisamuensis]SDD26328.1 Reverse transcriptase (RNA-dependent DNA polymerase) [Rhodococcus tukisamuensis]